MRASRYVLEHIVSYGLKTAQVDAETRRIVTFDEIRRKSKSLTKWLRLHGFGRGCTIGLLSRNSLDFAWILLGIWESGAVCHLIDFRYTLREVIHALETAPVDVLILQRGVFQTLACSETEQIKHIFEFGEENVPYSEAATPLDTIFKFDISVNCMAQPSEDNTSPEMENEPDPLVLILSSSGTTGLPKGVMHTEDSIFAGLKLGSSNILVQNYDKTIGLLPFHHVYGLSVMLNCLCVGALMVVMPKFSLPFWIETIQTFSITRLHLVPSLLLTLLKSNTLDFRDLLSVKHVCVGGAPMFEDSIERYMDKFLQPVVIQKVYGCTECFHYLFSQVYDARRPRSLGKVAPSLHVKIVDLKSREVLGPNSVGEICIKGRPVAKGYINNPKANACAFDADRWFLTGDIGYFDEDGYFYFVDRFKNIIKYQGNQVSPSELEFVLIAHPNIVEAAVIGIEHEIFGQVPRAYVIPRECHDNTAQEIHDYMRSVLAPFKLLRGGLVYTSYIPKTSTGKVQRHSLHSMVVQKIHFDLKMKTYDQAEVDKKLQRVDAETHRRISFDDIKCKCAKLAKWFRAHNLGKGSTVGLMSSNNIDFIWILLGVWTSGAACRLICPKSTLYELIHALDITPVECLLMQKGKLKRLACPKISAVKYVLEFGEEKTHCSDGAITLEDALKDLKEDDHFDQSPQVKPTVQNETQNVAARDKSSNIPDDIALILTSSGTTGLPKCVMLTHDNIIAALKKRHLFVEKSAVALGLMPFRHAYGLITMVMCLCEGAVLVNMTSFSFLRWINIIKEFSVSHLHIVPSLSLSLLKSDIVNFEDLRSVRQIWVAAAPICEEAHEKLKKKFHQPVRIYKAYGLTEATFIVAFGEFERQKPGCIGKIVETMQCKIIDKDSGDDLPINKVGEVCFKGPMVAKGYVNDPEATAEIFCSGGWVRSGDLGSLDEAGCFYYVDRMKNIIKYQGQQISPCELETVLISHPDVKEAAVIGVPHEIFGEVPRAFIVPLDHSKVIAQDIHDYMKEMVAPFKQLIGGIVFLTELPKTGLGKVKRSTLLNFEPKTVFYDEIRGKISVHSHTLESGENRTEAVTTK